MVFGAHLGISKIRACLVLAIMRFFFFFCLPWYAWFDYAFVKIDFTRTIIIIIVFMT